MQIAPQIIPSEAAHPDADTRLREFARQLAETHTLEPAHLEKSDLLEHLQSWELALRNANAFFKSVPAKDLPVSRARANGCWIIFTSSNRPSARLKKICRPVFSTSYQNWRDNAQDVPTAGTGTASRFLHWRGNGLGTARARST